MDDHDMPPFEPIVPSNLQFTSAAGAAEAPLVDVHMQLEQSTSRDRNDNYDDHDSMPELQSVSNSSDSENSEDDDESDRDANEVEMQAVQDDDNDSSWTDDDGYMPSLEHIDGNQAPAASRRANRRARVEDDQDDERDRRHPSQRVADTMSINEPPPSTGPSTATATPVPNSMPLPPHLPPPNHPQPPQNQFGPPPMPTNQLPFRPLPRMPQNMLFRIPLGRFRATTQNVQNNNNNNNNNNNPNVPNPNVNFNGGQTMLGGFAITIDNNGTPVLHAHHHHHGPLHPNGNGPLNGMPGQPQPPGGGAGGAGFPQDLSALFNFFGNAIGIGGFGFGEREQEDPERAKRLVDGLEEVPIGLVRRLGRVGGGGLEGEDGVGASGGDSGCAICWDSLLDGDLKGWENKEKKEEGAEGGAEEVPMTTVPTGTDAEVDPSVEPSTSADTDMEASPSQEAESSAKTDSKTGSVPAPPKIVSLPCAHVFHAACLIPWFSRPRQTTCPTCRFNIDPENLTYVRRRRAPAARNNNAAQGQGAAQGQPQGEQPLHQNIQQPSLTPFAVPTQNAGTPDAVPAPAPVLGGGNGAGNGANINTNANLGGNPDPTNPFHQIILGPGQFEQASLALIAGVRADLDTLVEQTQFVRDNPPNPGEPGGLDNVTDALQRAEASVARVEQWLQRAGLVGEAVARLAEQVQGAAGTPVGNANDTSGEAAGGAIPAPASDDATVPPATALLHRLNALETALVRVNPPQTLLVPPPPLVVNVGPMPANVNPPSGPAAPPAATQDAQPQSGPAPTPTPAPGTNAGAAPPPPNALPNNNGPPLGFLTFGFDVFIGGPNGPMDVDGGGMMDGDGGGDMMLDDDGWIPIPVVVDEDGEGADGNGLPPLEPIPRIPAMPAQFNNNAQAPPSDANLNNNTAPNNVNAAPNLNPNAHFRPGPMNMNLNNMGPGVHVAAGAGRTLNEAMASLFEGWGPGQGQGQEQGQGLGLGAGPHHQQGGGFWGVPLPPQQQHPGGQGQGPQGVPLQQAQQGQGATPAPAGDGPPTQPATPVGEDGPGAQNGAGGAPPSMQDFFSALLGSVPQGGFGRINPIVVGGRGQDRDAANPGTGPNQGAGQNIPNADAGQARTAGQANPAPSRNPPPANSNPGNNNNVDTWEQLFSLPPLDPTGTPPAGNGAAPQAGLPPFATLFGGPPPMPHDHAHAHAHAHPPFMTVPNMGPRRAPREKKQWTLPPPPGPTLRQRVERKEREAGLRCHDTSCGIGPSDEEPFLKLTDTMMKQLCIRSLIDGSSTERGVCSHMFHSTCLVSSERVALMGEQPNATGEDVEVSCPVCRAVGCIPRSNWEEGVQTLA